MAHPRLQAGMDLPAWKNGLVLVSAFFLGILFVVAGGWKLADPFQWSTLLYQFKVPTWGVMPATLALGISEMLAGAMLFVPKFRRWGAILTAALLLVFMIYVGIYYEDLRGKECSCFPWVKRTVGPAFFVVDGIWVLMAGLVALWSRVSTGLKTAAMMLGAIAVFAGVSYGVSLMQQTGTKAPDSITVEGQPYSLSAGRHFLYFYDPECMHCDEAARRMSGWKFRDAKVVGVPTRVPQFAAEFMKSTKLNAPNSPDLKPLRDLFPFVDPPFGVAIENGRQKTAYPIFDKEAPEKQLRELGWIE